VAHKLERDEHYEYRTHKNRQIAFHTYGKSGLGMDLTAKAWPSLTQVFSAGSGQLSWTTDLPRAPCSRPPPKGCALLRSSRPARTWGFKSGTPAWMAHQSEEYRSKTFWDPYWVLKETGLMAKRTVTKWSCEGYQRTCRTLHGLQVGGVVDRSWLVVARIPADALNRWAWPHFPEPVTRPMSNCLRPTGVPWSAYHSSPKHQDGPIPHANENSMPARLGSFIRTDQGMRRLLHDELAKGLGAPKTWLGDWYPEGGAL
jgi:hypothetical protein